MKKSILGPIAAGIVVSGLLRFIARKRFARFQPVFADRIRNMSDEEYAQFKARFQNRCGFHKQGNAMAE